MAFIFALYHWFQRKSTLRAGLLFDVILSITVATVTFPCLLVGYMLMAIAHFGCDFVAVVKKDPRLGSYVLDYGITLEHAHCFQRAGRGDGVGSEVDDEVNMDPDEGSGKPSLEMTSTPNPMQAPQPQAHSIRAVAAMKAAAMESAHSSRKGGLGGLGDFDGFGEEEAELFTAKDIKAILNAFEMEGDDDDSDSDSGSEEEEEEKGGRKKSSEEIQDLREKIDRQVACVRACERAGVFVYLCTALFL